MHPCSTDGTANMAAPYCGHLGIFLMLQVFEVYDFVKSIRFRLHALITPTSLKFCVFFMLYSYINVT